MFQRGEREGCGLGLGGRRAYKLTINTAKPILLLISLVGRVERFSWAIPPRPAEEGGAFESIVREGGRRGEEEGSGGRGRRRGVYAAVVLGGFSEKKI